MRLKKFSHSSMKKNNRYLVLNVIRKRGPISRAEIARLTGLTKSTVSEIVLFLEKAGIVGVKGEEEKRGAGRRGILLDVNYSKFLVIGYDIGTLRSRVVLTDLEGNILRKRSFGTIRGEKLLDQVRSAVEEIAEDVWNDVVGIGFGAPGMVDPSSGVIVHSPNLSLRDFPLVDRMKELFEKEVVLEHNVKLMMMAEMEYGHAKDRENILLVNLGPGIGASFTSERGIVRGRHNFTGEIGHTTVVQDGEPCSCGKRGCLETVAAAWGIVKNYEKETGIELDHPFDAEEVARRARSGDEIAKVIFKRAGDHLGRIIAQSVNMVDPELVILAGGLSKSWDLMRESFMRSFDENIIVPLRGKIEIAISDLGEYSTALGAATMMAERFFDIICS